MVAGAGGEGTAIAMASKSNGGKDDALKEPLLSREGEQQQQRSFGESSAKDVEAPPPSSPVERNSGSVARLSVQVMMRSNRGGRGGELAKARRPLALSMWDLCRCQWAVE